MRVRGLGLIVLCAFVVVMCAAGCGSDGGSAAGSGEREPSPQAKMICDQEAVEDITGDLLVKTVKAPEPGWTGDDYTCTYTYDQGAQIVLKVRDLPTTAAAGAYLEGLGRTLHRTSKDVSFGTEGAFAVPDGSVAVQKDSHVLLVDVSGLPKTWAVDPPLDRGDAAAIVASAIMGCWVGDDH